MLVGIVIGRLSMNGDDVDHVYLRNSQPSPTGTAKSPRDRPPLQHASRAASPPSRSSAPIAQPSPQAKGTPGRQRGPGGNRGNGRMVKGFASKKVVDLVNAARRKAGCGPLRVDPRLVKSAMMHSLEMARSNDFDHDSPGGETPWSRMADAGYKDGGAENIARGYQSAEAAVRGWMASPGHSRNILNCRLEATGVWVALGPGGPWWTQDFGYS
ncbi:CAP domain-containing protein [Planotetraspora thailandica]|nr:CAP domain-containing protein [Planotetraspora thailandica]